MALYEELASRSCGKCNGGYSMKMDEDTKKGILESMFIVHNYCPDAFEMEICGKCNEECVPCWIKTLCKEVGIENDFTEE